VSVIVAVSNRPGLVAALRASYQQNNNECAEVVVVHSADDQDWLEKRLCVLNLPITHIGSGKRSFNKSYQVNIGAAVARGELLMLQDADVILPSGFLEAAAYFATPTGMCCLAAVAEAEYPTRRRIAPGNLLCRRDTFTHIGGMSSDLVGWGWEDLDLLIRLRLAGVEIFSTGVGIHLTHSDRFRSIIDSVDAQASDGKNRLISLERISRKGISGTYEVDVNNWMTRC